MKVLIVAAGEPPSPALLKEKLAWCDWVVAVDGGLLPLMELQTVPDAVVGDMDSVETECVERMCKLGSVCERAQVEKNDTDAFLALEMAVKRGACEVVLLGGTGGRIDHLLSNIMLLKWAQQKNICLVIEDDLQTLELGQGRFECKGEVGQTVSLIPADKEATVTVSGMKYPLQGLLLTNSRPRGVSNILQRQVATIETDNPLIIIKLKKAQK